MKTFKTSKKWLLDKLNSTIFYKHIDAKKDDELYFCIMNKEELRTEQQRKSAHMIIAELWKSGETSFNSYKELRDDIKQRNGFIEIKAPDISERLRPKINKFYLSLDEIDRKEFAILIMNRTIRSLSDATREEYIIIMKDLLWLVDELGVSSKQLDDARDMWLNSH